MNIFGANDHDLPDGRSIRLRSGAYMNLMDPDPEAIQLTDIATALSLICRFNGHVGQFYSVAEHSLVVCNMLMRQFGETDLALWGLFHDAPEAYLGDVTRPLKGLIPEYKVIEAKHADAIRRRFKFPHRWDTDHRVKAADEQALVWEMASVRDAEWRTPSHPPTVAKAFVAMALDLGVR